MIILSFQLALHMVRRSSTCGTLHRKWHGVHGVQSDSPFWIMLSSCTSFITSTCNKRHRSHHRLCYFSFFFSRSTVFRYEPCSWTLWLSDRCTIWVYPSNTSPSSRHTMDLYSRRSSLLIFTHGWPSRGCFVLLHFCCSVCSSSSYKYQLAFFYATASHRLCAAGNT